MSEICGHTYGSGLEKAFRRTLLADTIGGKRYQEDINDDPAITKIYDIYALGMVLLEIGVCQTAASIRDEAKSRLGPAARASFVPKSFMEAYVALATSALPRWGISYRDAVLTCLNGDSGTRRSDRVLEWSFIEV